MKTIFLLVFILRVCSLSGFSQSQAPISVLIVDGFSNHDWRQTSKVVKGILEDSGLFEVDVMTMPRDSMSRMAWQTDFSKYRVIIQNTNNIREPNLRWSPEAEKDLENFVSSGGGLFVFHSANNAFSHWKAYNEMIGMGWRSKSYGYALGIDQDQRIIRYKPGEGEDTGHGDRFNALIQVKTSHPINRGFPAKWQTADTEVYNYPRGPAKNLTVLSYAYDSTGTQMTWPIEWVVAYGKGRVYNSSMGHLWEGDVYPPSFRCIGFQTTLIRATEWLATGDTSYPVPENFPSAYEVRLRGEDQHWVNDASQQEP